MNIQQLKYALEIHRCKSFNKASQTLFVSQPALSLSMQDLERDLGFLIFERTTRGIHPTPEGYTFLDAAANIVAQIEEMQTQYSQSKELLPPSIVRIATSRYSFVTKAMIDFYQKHFEPLSRFSIHLDEVDCHQVIQDIFSSKADLGIIHVIQSDDTTFLDNLTQKGVVYKWIATSRSYVMFQKGHPLEQLQEITTSDFIQYPQVRITSRESDFYSDETAFNLPFYGNPAKNIFTNNRNQLYDFLSMSNAVFLGITNVSISVFHSDLVTRAVANDPTMYHIYAIYLKKHPPNLYIKDFIEILKEQFAKEYL